MASEQLVKAVIRAALPPSPSLCNEGKLAFAVHAAFAAAGYVLISSDEKSCLVYTYVYWNPEKSNQKVVMEAYGMNGTLLVTVQREGTRDQYYLTLTTAEYVKAGGTPYASYFKNLGKLVDRFNEAILYSMEGTTAAVLSNQPSISETRVIESSPIRSSETRVIEVSDDDDDDDSPRPGHDKQSMYLSRNSGSRMGFEDPDNHNARNNGIFVPSYSGYVVPPINGSGGGDRFPGAGVRRSRGNGGSGGMLSGPNDLMVYGRRTRDAPGMSGGPSDVRPGVRFDPYGSPDVGGYEPDYYYDRSPPSSDGGMHPDMAHFRNGSKF